MGFSTAEKKRRYRERKEVQIGEKAWKIKDAEGQGHAVMWLHSHYKNGYTFFYNQCQFLMLYTGIYL
jgi:hypothetical protein